MPETKFGSFEDLLEITAPELRGVAAALKALVLDVEPSAVEVVRLGDRAATYGVGLKKMSEGYVYILPHAKWINFGFYRGADLEDPGAILEGTGAKMRHVKIRNEDACKNPALRNLIQAAIVERKTALGRK